MILRILLLVLAAALPLAAGAAEEVDYLGLAALLLKDGHYDRAEGALANIDESDKSLDRVRYFTLKGLIKLRNRFHEEAKAALQTAIEAGQDDPVVHLYLAQAHFGLKEYRETLEALARAGEAAAQHPDVVVFRAQAHWQLGQRKKAWDVLVEAGERFPDQGEFLRRRVFMLIELGLYRTAVELGLEYAQRYGAGEADLLAIGRALRESGEAEKALRFLEQAYLRYPASESAILELAHTYIKADRVYAAAYLFEQAGILNRELISEASELYRDSGRLLHALNLNARIADPVKKMKQRLALLIALKQFEAVAAMHKDLARVGLLDDEAVRYALAYAYFQTDRFDAAERQLAGIASRELFDKATALRSAMAECEDDPWQCL